MQVYRLIIVLVFGLSGCATSGIEAIGKPIGKPEFAKHLVIHNEPFADNIIINDMHTRTVGNLLEVSIVLENLTGTDQNIQYQFSWYSSDNFEIEQGTEPWTPAVLHGKATLNMQALAPNSTVTTYKITVREQ